MLLGLAQKALNKKKTRAVVFVSGDVHYAELMAKRMPKSTQFGAAQVRKWISVASCDRGDRSVSSYCTDFCYFLNTYF